MEHEAKRWLATAQTDFNVAKHLFNTFYPKPLEIICYHCQQCAEKAIKAVIISKGAPGGMPKLHDLSFLLNQLKNSVEIDEKYYDYADTLTPYGVAVRYPNELFLEEHHAENALKMASEFLAWAKKAI
ncbi:MAG: HEPN domain-containing protein [Oscillospiraceae bacterium]|nr:HEPN domain-containing protein [Oscillospiraceae bacterium]MCD8374899.1 HEPN domain-containing protein [Oscillospiraceae bacterium]